MAGRESAYVAGRLRRYAKAQKPRLKKLGQVIPENEQVRRFLAGDEAARVESGEITPEQFAEYERVMVEKVREMQAEGA